MSQDARVPVSLTTIFQYLIFINQDNCSERVVTIKYVCVIWGSSTFLHVIIIKNLVSTKLCSFDQTKVYVKAVPFLPIIFLEQKGFLNIVYSYERLYLLKDLLLSYKLSSQSFAQSFKIGISHPCYI